MVVDSLKALDPKRPIREADVITPRRNFRKWVESRCGAVALGRTYLAAPFVWRCLNGLHAFQHLPQRSRIWGAEPDSIRPVENDRNARGGVSECLPVYKNGDCCVWLSTFATEDTCHLPPRRPDAKLIDLCDPNHNFQSFFWVAANACGLMGQESWRPYHVAGSDVLKYVERIRRCTVMQPSGDGPAIRKNAPGIAK